MPLVYIVEKVKVYRNDRAGILKVVKDKIWIIYCNKYYKLE